MKKIGIALFAILCQTSCFALDLSECKTAADSIKALLPVNKYRFGYTNVCDADGKKLYEEIVRCLAEFKFDNPDKDAVYNPVDVYPSNIGVSGYNLYSFSYLINRMDKDMPELFLLASPVGRTSKDGKGFSARVKSSVKPSDYAKDLADVVKTSESVVSQLTDDMTEYQKVVFIHDWICKNVSYGDMSSADGATLRGALINKRAVCDGWARAFLFLCQRAGIECLYVTGGMNTKPGEPTPTWTNHAYNFVKVYGEWYLVDTTSDGGLGGCAHYACLRGQDYFDGHYELTYKDVNSNSTAYPTQYFPSLAKGDCPENAAAVENVKAESASNKLYDLSGKSLTSVPNNTVVIVNGKKVINK